MSKTSLYTSAAHAVFTPNSCEEYRCQRTHFPIYGKMYHSREGLNFPKNVPERAKSTVCFFRALVRPSTRTGVTSARNYDQFWRSRNPYTCVRKRTKNVKNIQIRKLPKNIQILEMWTNLQKSQKISKNLKKSQQCATSVPLLYIKKLSSFIIYYIYFTVVLA
jgi:hypothetical protein